MLSIIVLLLLCLGLQVRLNAAEEVFPAQELADHVGASHGPWDDEKVVLNGNFGMRWRVVQGDQLILLLASWSTVGGGWMGFGFGEPSSGSMLGADLVLASLSDGAVKVSDTHVPFSAYPLTQAPLPFPEADDIQDWSALGGKQTEDGMVVVLQRKLDTGDNQDRAVSLEKGTRVLFAYGFGNSPAYHGGNRGVAKINFGKVKQVQIPSDADSFFDVVAPDVVLPDGVSDSYLQYAMDLGDNFPDIVGADFNVVSPSPHFVHHIILYDCGTSDKKDWLRNFGKVEVVEASVPISTCVPMFGWALGGDDTLVVPRDAALKGIRYVVLEAHFNQPVMGYNKATGEPDHAGAGTTDASGFRLYTTSKPRRLRAGSMLIKGMGQTGNQIPAGAGAVHYESICSGECTKRNPQPLHVYNSFLHMHNHGRQIWASHYDQDLNFEGYIGKTEFWNANFQNYVPVNVTIYPGDTIGVHCVFDTNKQQVGPLWGDRTEDEMCLVILQFYSEEEAPVKLCGGMTQPAWTGIEHPVAVCNADVLFDGTNALDPSLEVPCDVTEYGTFPLTNEYNPQLFSDREAFECASHHPSMGHSVALVSAVAIVSLALLLVTYTDIFRNIWAKRTASGRTESMIDDSSQAKTPDSEHFERKTDGNLPSQNESLEDGVPALEEPGDALLHRAKEFVKEKHNVPESESVLERFHQNVKSDPDKLLYAWLDDKTNVVNKLTRQQLWDKSRDLAFHLQNNCGVKPGDRVMIVYPFGIEFMVGFVALLRMGAVIVSVFPPNPKNLTGDIPKFAHFVEDCGATVALTTTDYHRLVQTSRLVYKTWPQGITWVKSDAQRPLAPESYMDYIPNPENTALIQYTSGSTSSPKGVMISYANMNHQVSFLQNCYHVYAGTSRESTDEIVNVSWTPQFHDMGLFGSFIVYLSLGGTSYSMSPISFLRDPTKWVKAMVRYKATVTNGPNFAFALTCKRLRERSSREDRMSFSEIPSMKFVVYGAEPSDIRLLGDIEKYMGINRRAVASMYGLAEHVVAVSSGASQTLYDDMLWSVGNLEFTGLLGGIKIRIVNPDTRKGVPTGDTGEIWISSPGVATGYWGREEMTTSHFTAKLEDGNEDVYLRTGDLGFVRDNELFLVSRMKDLIIINGKNIAPTDIEHAAEEGFPKMLRPGSSAAFQATDQSAVLLCEIRPEATSLMSMELLVAQILKHVHEAVSGSVLEDVVLLEKGATRKTSSGKVKRHAMKSLWQSGDLKRLAQSEVAAKWTLFRKAQSVEELFRLMGVTDFELTLVENGIDSMQLLQLVEIVSEQFGLQMNYNKISILPVKELLVSLKSPGAEGPVLRLPCDTKFSEDAAKKILPGALARWFRQSMVVLVVVAVVAASFVPSAVYIRKNWDYRSDLWIHHYRHGPMVAFAFPIWALTYSAACILLKWILVGKLRPGQSFGMWSGGFARWWTITRLAAIWELFIGAFVADTLWKNLFYKAMGGNIALSARLHCPIDCWDLVTVGPRSEINGAILPRLFHWTGAYFQRISIGPGCHVGHGGVIMAGSDLASGIKISNRSVVPPGAGLKEKTTSWSSVPCSAESHENAGNSATSYSLVSMALRATVPFLLFSTVVGAWWIANEISPGVPHPDVSFEGDVQEMNERLYRLSVYFLNWNSSSFGVWSSSLVTHEIAGLLLLGACWLLKWSFVCPYMVDRMEPLILGLYFPFIPKTFLHGLWHRLFGMRIGQGSVVLSTGTVVSPSIAHQVQVGSNSIVFSCRFLPCAAPPNTAENVWQWLSSRGRLRNPWSSILAPADIVVGNSCECAAGSFIEEGVTMKDRSGTATATRVTHSVDEGKRVVGNPVKLTLASKTSHPTLDVSSQEQLPLRLCMLIRNILAVFHFAYLFAGIITILEVTSNLPFPSTLEIEYTMPCQMIVAFGLLVILLALEILFVKWVMFGRTKASSIPLRTLRALIYHHLQVLDSPFPNVMFPVFSGTFLLPLFYKLLGANLGKDVSSIFLAGYLDPGDADCTTLRPHSVLDERSFCVCHRVDHGMLHQGSVLLNSGATLHPGAVLMLGSLGRGSQLFPLSKSLRETHTKNDELWIGNPSVRAEYTLFEDDHDPEGIDCPDWMTSTV